MVKKAIMAFFVLICIVLNGMEKNSDDESEQQSVQSGRYDFIFVSRTSSGRVNHLRKNAMSIGEIEERGEGALRKELSEGSMDDHIKKTKLVRKFIERQSSLQSLTGQPEIPFS